MKPSSCLSVCFSLMLLSEMGFARFISWDDLIVEDIKRNNNHEQNAEEAEKNGVNVVGFVVDRNGKGDSETVQGAVEMVPDHNQQRVKIHILPGVYSEKVYVPASKPYISFIGDPDAPDTTVIAWHNRASDIDESGHEMGTFRTASVTIESDYFCSAGITYQNTVQFQAGAKGNQAVALKISGNHSMFYRSRFLGSQDTLLDETGTHFFFKCFVQGSVDFIFGNARSLYKECELSVVGESYAIAAQRRQSADDNGVFSFVNCTVNGTGSVFLGRAWGDYSRVIYSYSVLNIDVKPQGWDDWGEPSRQNTVMFGEYMCRGKGANRSGRVAWSKALNHREARPFLDSTFIDGKQWLRL